MNVAEKVATLEALLQRVQRNAAAPRTRTQLPVSAELVPHRGEAPGAIANDSAGAAWPDGGLSAAEASPASEARPAAAASAVAAGGSPRAPEPVLDEARHVAASPAAQAPQTAAASAAKQPAAAARAPQEAQPAAKAPQQAAAAKTPQQPPVRTPAAATSAAGAARTPAAATAARMPAGAPQRTAAGRPAASLDLPRAEARDAGAPVGGQETYRPPAEAAEPKPREAARTAASRVTAPAARSAGQGRDALAGGPAVPPARGSSPRAEGKPFFPNEDVTAKARPVESDSELSFAGLLPDEPEPAPKQPPALKLPAERRPEPAAAEARRSLADRPEAAIAAREAPAVSEPVTPKAVAEPLAAATRRAMGEPAVDRELSREMVDDEPTVIRGMLEDEPTVIRSRPEGLEDEETAVRSARSEAQALARSVHDQETVDAGPGVLPKEAAEEAERTSRPKPIDRDQLPKVITKDPPIAPADKGPKPSEVATTRPPADTSASVTERPAARPRSRAGLVIAAVALLVAGAAVAHRLGLFGSEPSPPTDVVPDNTAGAAQDTAQPPATAPTAAATPAEAAPAETAPAETAPAAPAETAPAAPSAAETAAPAADSAESLPSTRGHLLVNSPEKASVYVNGSLAGNTGDTLEVPCGTRYVRLGKLTTEKTATPNWLSAGQAVIVGCRKKTVLSINPTPASPPAERPAKRKASPSAAPAADQEGAAPAPAGDDAPAPAGEPAP
ncbi:hypothetical protein [Sorangium sp. So ce854]|uniref:hypothetical protein n=1 Tax=Sorangium sp. So ce854 TaxID=3133322 RepID=UPI003F64080C